MILELQATNTNCSRIINRNIMKPQRDCAIWCSMPLIWPGSSDCNSTENGALQSWRIWDEFRMSSDQHHRVSVVLRIGEDLPLEYAKDYERWAGEPVKAIIIPKSLFRLNKKGYPVLLKTHQDFILKLAHLDPYLIIEVSLSTWM